MASKDEQVLVIPRDVFDQVGDFQGLMFDTDSYLEKIFAPGGPRFMPRSLAESDPSYKQIIPYVIITHQDKYLCYVRGKRAGETRLVGQMSIGIGGHINPVDGDVPLLGFRNSYEAAVEREVDEEINVRANHHDRIVALLNDDSNPVGSVHLGVVHYWTLDSFDVDKKEQMITKMSFADSQELQTNREAMETWSRLCLDHLDDMAKHANFKNSN